MNKLWNLSAALTLAFAVALPSTALSKGPRGNAGGGGTATTVTANLEQYEIDTMLFMREEEKLARDVYLQLHEIWGTPIFANIAVSEQRHMDSVLKLLDKYGLEDSALPAIGGFSDSDLQKLHDSLIDQGKDSQLEALYAGGFIEETDIIDLQNAIDATDKTDIINVYENLLKGSRNHLRAFVSAIESQGVVYVPQALTEEELDAIVDSPMERG
jgi:hypothetical protein